MNRAPGFFFGLAVAAGVASARWTCSSQWDALVTGATLVVLLGLVLRALFLLRCRVSRWSEACSSRHAARLLVFYLLGLARAVGTGADPPPPHHDAALVELSGVIVTPPLSRSRSLAGTLRLETGFDLALDGGGRDRVIGVRVPGRVEHVRAGDAIVVRGRLHAPRRRLNPGGAPRSGETTLDVPHSRCLVRCPGSGALFDVALGKVRGTVASTITHLYDERPRGVLLALLLGDRRLLPAAARRSFECTGTFHLLALSGLHVGILFAAVARVPIPAPARLLFRILFLGGFCLLTGGSPPVVRAALMLSVHLLLQAARRAATPLNSLGWSAIVLLAWAPGLLDDWGFQLSFVGVASILLGTGGRDENDDPGVRDVELRLLARPGAGRTMTGRLARGCFTSLRASCAAWCGTFPLVLLHFHRVHLFSPLWNVVAGPFVSLLVAGGALSVALGMIHPRLGAPSAWLTSWSCELLIRLLDTLGRIPGSLVRWPPPPGLAVATALATLLALVAGKRTAARLLGLVTLLVVLVGSPSRTPRSVELWTLDVGASDAACLRVPGAGVYLVDAGGPGSGERAGAEIVQALLALGESRIAGAFLTHAHDDHIRGAVPIARSLPLERVWTSPYFVESNGGASLVAELRGLEVPLEALWRGCRLRLRGSDDTVVEVLGPEPRETLPLRSHRNETSLALRIVCRGEAVLLLGDLEEAGLARLLGSPGDLRSEVLMFPHHGRFHQLWRPLLRRTRPRAVIISGNGEGGARRVATRLESLGLEVFCTWRGGAIRTAWREGAGWQVSYWATWRGCQRSDGR